MVQLYSIHYSPWSEKARWALDAAGITYEKHEYLPFFGEPALRARLKQWGGRVSVPILFANEGDANHHEVLRDSFEIARWASHNGDSKLLPFADEVVIGRWNDQSERLLSLGRERTTALVKADPDALLESLPKAMRRLGPVSRGLGAFGAIALQRKYAMSAGHTDLLEFEMRSIVQELADALSGGDTLVGDGFTYADITMAVGLQFVCPPERIRLGRKSRAHWTVPSIVQDFPEVIAWRDRLYATHR